MSLIAAATAARRALAEVLEAATGHPWHPEVPSDVTPPCGVLEPADRYLEDDVDTFEAGTYVLTLEAWALVDLASTETATDVLDQLLEDTLGALAGVGWWMTSVGKPASVESDGWLAYGANLTVQTHLSTTP